MKIKNVIVVCDFANITGGAERVAITSAVSLAETGSNVVMFTGKGPVCYMPESRGSNKRQQQVAWNYQRNLQSFGTAGDGEAVKRV